MQDVLTALLEAPDPPVHYGLTLANVRGLVTYFDWESFPGESNWSQGTKYETLAEMIRAEPAQFLADISRYYGDDYYLVDDEDVLVITEDDSILCRECADPLGPGDSDTCTPCVNELCDEFDDSMDGDHESALASVYGPND